MPDITMCANKECELKENCYRQTAKPSFWQSYSGYAPENGVCEKFINTVKER